MAFDGWGELARIIRFGVVGLGATAAYAATAWSLTVMGRWPAVAASLSGWTVSTLLSYLGHRILTFRSAGRADQEVPRFAALAVGSLVLVLALPAVLTDGLGFDPAVAVGLACVIIPAASYAVMARLVFLGHA